VYISQSTPLFLRCSIAGAGWANKSDIAILNLKDRANEIVASRTSFNREYCARSIDKVIRRPNRLRNRKVFAALLVIPRLPEDFRKIRFGLA
jgi:hypothetical protein